jgi:hypothetical protein
MLNYASERDRYIAKAKEAERSATKVAEIWYDRAARELEIRRGRAFTQLPLEERRAQIRDLRDQWKQKDPVWKSHVANNQWYIQQAIMYGTAANGEALERVLTALSLRG